MATSPWYREGTAKFTQGSTTVTGTGTRWVDFVRAGDGIQGPDGKLYQVTNVASNTSMSITPAYGNETTYWTIPIQGYVKRLADAASQLVRDFEGGADEALDAADRAKQSATEANASEAAALSQANRAESEADRAETEADRAQQAADDAVAVVTDGGGSIEPEAGKWPVAGAEGTIKQAWVDSLEFALDKLRVATNKALYGDGPYPVMDFQFQGANMLDPRINFTRASKDWDEYGNEYGIDEPVLTDKGLWVSGARTNLLTQSKDFSGWLRHSRPSTLTLDYAPSPIGLGSAALWVGEQGESGSMYISRGASSTSYEEGKSYVASFFVKFQPQQDVGSRIEVQLHSSAFGDNAAAVFCYDGTVDVTGSAIKGGAEPVGGGFVRLWVSATATQAVTAWSPLLYYYSENLSDGIVVSNPDLKEGVALTPYIPTEGSQVTVAATKASISVVDFDYNVDEGAFLSSFSKRLGIPVGFVFSQNTIQSNNGHSLAQGSGGNVVVAAANGIDNLTLGLSSGVGVDRAAFSYDRSKIYGSLNGQEPLFLSADQDRIASRISIGSDRTMSSGFLNGYILSLVYFNKKLSANSMQELTS